MAAVGADVEAPAAETEVVEVAPAAEDEAAPEPARASMSDVVGWYELHWAKGSFPVCFRPGGNFFCAKFQASSKWSLTDNKINLNWDKYGKYELAFDPDTKSMDGHSIPKTDTDHNWRRASFLRSLSAVESILFGDGAGSQWELEHSGGKFSIEFKCDGYNHFQCSDFPAHSHWVLNEDDSSITIVWGQYGTYRMVVDAENGTMAGGVAGEEDKWDTDDQLWRKAKFVRKLVGAFHCSEH